jgi:hypothetical protein
VQTKNSKQQIENCKDYRLTPLEGRPRKERRRKSNGYLTSGAH